MLQYLEVIQKITYYIFQKVIMSLALSFVDFCNLMSVRSESVLSVAKKNKGRPISDKKFNEASAKLKESFKRLFGVSYEDAKENIDWKSWRQNIDFLYKGHDVNFGKVTVAKRKRKSQNDSLNESLLLSMEGANVEESEPVVDYQKTIRELTAVVEIQKRKIESMQGVFRKTRVSTNSRNGGGSVLEFSSETKAFAIGCMAQGESACSVRRMLEQMVVISPELIQVENGIGGIPSLTTLNRWRDLIPGLNQIQCQSFIDSSERIIIGVDESEVSKTSILNLGCFNETGDYHCLLSRVIEGRKTGVVIAEAMHSMIAEYENLSDKIVGTASDQGASQLCANRILAEILGKELEQYNCSMHSAKIIEKDFNDKFPLGKQAVECAAVLFGTRQSAGNSINSIRPALEIALKIEKNIRFSRFRTSVGCRFAIDFSNGKELIANREIVIKVCDTAPGNRWAVDLKKLMTTDWHRCLHELGAMILHWKSIVSPFYSKLGKLVTLGETRGTARELLDKYTQLDDSSDPYSYLLSGFEHDHECYGVISQHWSTTDAVEKSNVNKLVKSAVLNASTKVKKDVNLILKLKGDHQLIVPMTNKRCESTFSLLKVSFIQFMPMFYLLIFSALSPQIHRYG